METINRYYNLDKQSKTKDKEIVPSLVEIESFIEFLKNQKIKATYNILKSGNLQEIEITLENKENRYKFFRILTRYGISMTPDSIRKPCGTYVVYMQVGCTRLWESDYNKYI